MPLFHTNALTAVVTTSLTFPCKNLLLGGHICSIIMILVTRLTDVISDQKNNWYLGMFVFLLYVLGGAVAHTQVFLQKVHWLLPRTNIHSLEIFWRSCLKKKAGSANRKGAPAAVLMWWAFSWNGVDIVRMHFVFGNDFLGCCKLDLSKLKATSHTDPTNAWWLWVGKRGWKRQRTCV